MSRLIVFGVFWVFIAAATLVGLTVYGNLTNTNPMVMLQSGLGGLIISGWILLGSAIILIGGVKSNLWFFEQFGANKNAAELAQKKYYEKELRRNDLPTDKRVAIERKLNALKDAIYQNGATDATNNNFMQMAAIATDDFPQLWQQYQEFKEGIEKLKNAGMPGAMGQSGAMWGYARWFYKIAFVPLALIVLYVMAEETGITDQFSIWWKGLMVNNPSLSQFFAVLLTLSAVAALGWVFFGPMWKLGLLDFLFPNSVAREKPQQPQRLFFTMQMRTESGYNTIFVIAGVIITAILGAVVTLVNPALGATILLADAMLVAAWQYYQKQTRPFFGFGQNGEVKIEPSFGRTRQFNYNDCTSIEMVYGDSVNFNRIYQRPLVQAINEATGASSLFPYKLVFHPSVQANDDELVIYNAKFTNGEYINPQDIEILVAVTLKKMGFNITVQRQGTHIAGWKAIKN